MKKGKQKRIILTGGGTAGHVIPNLALLPSLSQNGWQAAYIGSRKGIEKGLVQGKLPYHGIQSGKWRRYFDVDNFKDVFRVLIGIIQAFRILGQYRPQVVFSKGGFVGVPVVIAAWLRGIPVVLHEADMTPGLANRLSIPLCKKIGFSFDGTAKYLPSGKRILTGLPVRREILEGNARQAQEICRFAESKPVIMVMGGSLGAEAINQVLRESLTQLTSGFNIIHICGKSKIDPSYQNNPAYRQFDFVTLELPHFFAATHLVVSRAGANSLFEFIALRLPALLIPLPEAVSRGDQVQNARFYQSKGFGEVLMQENLTPARLCQAIAKMKERRQAYCDAMHKEADGDAISTIIRLLDGIAA